MTIYGETLVIGIDLKKLINTRPRGIGEAEWEREYNNFWPDYMAKNTHHNLFMFAHGMPPETIVFGCRAEFYFTHYPHKSFNQFKKLVVREMAKHIKVTVSEDDIQPYYVQYTLDEEDIDVT